jgi:hypothetical protein
MKQSLAGSAAWVLLVTAATAVFGAVPTRRRVFRPSPPLRVFAVFGLGRRVSGGGGIDVGGGIAYDTKP